LSELRSLVKQLTTAVRLSPEIQRRATRSNVEVKVFERLFQQRDVFVGIGKLADLVGVALVADE